MSFTCRPRNRPCIDDVCRSENDCAWPPNDDHSNTHGTCTPFPGGESLIRAKAIGTEPWLLERFPEKDWHRHPRTDGRTDLCDGTPSDCASRPRIDLGGIHNDQRGAENGNS